MLFNSGTPSLVDRTRHWVGDPAASPNPMWDTTADIKPMINTAYNEMMEAARRIGATWDHAIAYETGVDGTILYSTPTGFVRLLRAYLSGNGSNLSTATPANSQAIELKVSDTDEVYQLYNANSLTSPRRVFLQDTQLGILGPITATEAGTNSIQWIYEAEGTELSANGDEPVFPEAHQDLICIKAAIYLRPSRDLPINDLVAIEARKEAAFRAYCKNRVNRNRTQILAAGLRPKLFGGRQLPKVGRISKG